MTDTNTSTVRVEDISGFDPSHRPRSRYDLRTFAVLLGLDPDHFTNEMTRDSLACAFGHRHFQNVCTEACDQNTYDNIETGDGEKVAA
ncbi:hypothetical protein [Aeromicrobium sp. 179-A 4D2 NHS]|uniref:hypothetical protein n=1 Tax=Aeromicrobium sp. 179-A 4D2 NHS TaxID=3142375 RepID=UPI0039A1BFF3